MTRILFKLGFLSTTTLFMAIFGTLAQNPAAIKTVREQLLLDFGWKFHLGDAASVDGDIGYGKEASFAKAAEASGPADPGFSDSTWRTLDIPHDWAVELEFVQSKEKMLHDHGFKPIGRQFPRTSIGWYRRSFTVPASDKGKRVAVKFDGVFRDCIVWLNGHFLGRNLSGYSEFSFDITDYLVYGVKNVLALRVDATQAEGWFYEGAGIYRHTWLMKYSPLHMPLYGTYVTTEVGASSATVNIETKISNQQDENAAVQLQSFVVDENGTAISKYYSDRFNMNGYEEKTLRQQVTVAGPHLWSPEKPYLYKVISIVKRGEESVDN